MPKRARIFTLPLFKFCMKEEIFMSYTLCEKVRNLEPYEPISGTYRIRLDANESFYNMPDEIKDEIKDIIDKINFNRYPDPTAEKVIKAFSEYYGLNPEIVTATNGSDEMLYILSSAMLQKNSKVLIIEPDFSMYHFYSSLSENNVTVLKKSDTLKIDVDEVIEAANKINADMVIFSNPCNPTGQGVAADDVRRLVTSVNALVVLDEAYMDFWNQSLLNETEQYDNLIVLKTSSKAVGSAAIRLAFAVANKTLTKALKAVKSPYNVNTLTQEIGCCIFSHKKMLQDRCNTIVKNTKELYNMLNKLKKRYYLPFEIYEPCANFVFIKSEIAYSLWKYLLDNGIAIRYFKNLDALRITAGSTEETDELMKYIEKYTLEKYISENR